MLKLVSLNIEGSKHLDLVVPFIKSEMPDVFCAQEIFSEDVNFLERELGMNSVFVPQAYHALHGEERLTGVAIFSKNKMENTHEDYYVGEKGRLLHVGQFDHNTKENFHEMMNRFVLSLDVILRGEVYHIATTHFTWAPPPGNATVHQVEHLKKLISIMDKQGDFVLAGDFNAPRGQEIFDALSKKYKDNIPPEYKTSIDQNLHKVKGIQNMVDGLFTTSKYVAKNVRLQDGVSDHMAIVSEISIVN